MENLKNHTTGRTIAGFFISPGLGMVASAVALCIQHPKGFGWLDGTIPKWEGAGLYVRMFGGYAYIGMLALGLPLHWLLKRLRLQQAWVYLLLGPVAALLFTMVLSMVLTLRLAHYVFVPFAFGFLHPTIIGAVTFTVFRWITVKRNHLRKGEEFL